MGRRLPRARRASHQLDPDMLVIRLPSSAPYETHSRPVFLKIQAEYRAPRLWPAGSRSHFSGRPVARPCHAPPSIRQKARSPPSQAGLTRLARALKKPVSGKPGIGAQFLSFNFPNNLICGITSSCRPVRTSLPWLLRTAARPRPTLAVAAAAGFRYLSEERARSSAG